MSDEYTFDQNSFTMETRVLVADTWQNEQEQFPTNADTSLSETMNDSFMTVADSTRDNSAQFFSVLETTSDTILNDMSHLTMDITHVQDDYIQPDGAEIVQEGQDNQDVVLFRVDGSDELYGFQMAQDEDGNMQKYQFQVRQTEDGQFETVPGTIQLIPANEEVILSENIVDVDPLQSIEHHHSEQIFIKTELDGFINEDTQQPVEDNDEDEMNQPGEDLQHDYNEELEQEDIDEELHDDDVDEIHHIENDTKEGILEEKTKLLYNEQYLETEDNAVNENGTHEEYLQMPEAESIIHEDDADNQEDPNPEDMIVYFNQQHVENPNKDGEDQYFQEEMDPNQVQVYIPEEDANGYASAYHDDINEQEDSEGEFIESIHITGEDEEYEQIIMSTDGKKPIMSLDSHINTTALRSINRVPKTSNKNSPYTFVIKNTEKENVDDSMTLKSVKRVNPRSILKSSVGIVEEKVVEPDVENKRFSKGKQAIQAKQFHNYISQTKILEAPIRQCRLPRKQKIQPLERVGEEIVVQEVVVSSNGFIETREDGILTERKPLVPSECIQLSDSEDEARRINKKRKRREKERQKATIVISSDSEDDDSTPTKKSRSSSNTDDDDEDDVVELIKKQENKCPKCPKSFPSAGSLGTHMQYHNYEESNTTALKSINLKTSVLNTKYQCSECNECFKNNILLSRHVEMHKNKSAKIECTLCRKLFVDRNQLLVHKRSHVKEQLFKSTNTKLTSPKKVNPNKKKSPEIKKPPNVETLKCKDCNKVFTTALLLTSHAKTHKKFKCSTCSEQFPSKLLLDDHILKNCVKSTIGNRNKRVSYIPPRRSIYSSPKRTTRRTTMFHKPAETRQSTPLKLEIACDSCDNKFCSHTELFKHKVVAHGLNTPDKTVGKEVVKKPLLHKQRVDYCGVPATNSLNKAFAGLRRNLQMCNNKDK